MGQQQLLIIILGTIVVGVAVAVGISTFLPPEEAANPTYASTLLVQDDIVNITTVAKSVYNQDLKIWTTTATIGDGAVVYVFSHEELEIDNTISVRRIMAKYGDKATGTSASYWAQ